jgi:hypothetical protein
MSACIFGGQSPRPERARTAKGIPMDSRVPAIRNHRLRRGFYLRQRTGHGYPRQFDRRRKYLTSIPAPGKIRRLAEISLPPPSSGSNPKPSAKGGTRVFRRPWATGSTSRRRPSPRPRTGGRPDGFLSVSVQFVVGFPLLTPSAGGSDRTDPQDSPSTSAIQS